MKSIEKFEQRDEREGLIGPDNRLSERFLVQRKHMRLIESIIEILH